VNIRFFFYEKPCSNIESFAVFCRAYFIDLMFCLLALR
jgi:hypothetical protein